jgi:hypothetical protein
MKPEEKYNEILNKYFDIEYSTPTWSNKYEKSTPPWDIIKPAMDIMIDEIINNLHWLEDSINFDKSIKFWNEVKKELEK